jgi:purine nucleosidase
MPQSPFGGKQPIGVIYNTSMNRPDAALALALLYGFEGRRESRMGAICVVGAGLNTAIFCDMVGRMYMLGPARNANSVLPVGLADILPLPPDSAMVRPAIERKNEKDEPRYARGIRRLSDTSLAEAVLRNGVIFNAEAVVVLSAPATYLAKSLDLLGVRDLYKERVKRLVIVDSGAPQKDVPAIRRILAEWPAPIFFCGSEVGLALPFPGARIETDFAWTPAHPVADAYRAYQPMPYDAPSHDLAAAHFAVHPDSGFFRLSEPGAVAVSDDGRMQFSPGGTGKVRSLTVEPAQKDKAIQAFVEIATAKPVPPTRFRPPADAAGKAIEAKPPDKPDKNREDKNQDKKQND